MAHDEHLGSPHFPFEELDAIVFELTLGARLAHIDSSDNAAAVIKGAFESVPLDTAPTAVVIDTSSDIDIEATLTTPILPEDVSQELLTNPDIFYLDTVAALICSHMFSLELVANGADAVSMIYPTFDIPNMAEQFHMLRTGRIWAPGETNHTIFAPPASSRRIALTSATDTTSFNLAIQSRHLTFIDDIWAASDQLSN